MVSANSVSMSLFVYDFHPAWQIVIVQELPREKVRLGHFTFDGMKVNVLEVVAFGLPFGPNAVKESMMRDDLGCIRRCLGWEHRTSDPVVHIGVKNCSDDALEVREPSHLNGTVNHSLRRNNRLRIIEISLQARAGCESSKIPHFFPERSVRDTIVRWSTVSTQAVGSWVPDICFVWGSPPMSSHSAPVPIGYSEPAVNLTEEILPLQKPPAVPGEEYIWTSVEELVGNTVMISHELFKSLLVTFICASQFVSVDKPDSRVFTHTSKLSSNAIAALKFSVLPLAPVPTGVCYLVFVFILQRGIIDS